MHTALLLLLLLCVAAHWQSTRGTFGIDTLHSTSLDKLKSIVTRLFIRETEDVPARPAPTTIISIAYPRLLAKGRAAKFLFHVYPRSIDKTARGPIQESITEDMEEKTNDSQRHVGERIAVRLHCPVVEFTPEEQTVRIENRLNKIAFIGIPLDTAAVTEHDVSVKISKAERKDTSESIEFKIRIVDYAFDHVSRPLISKISSAVSACVSAGSFILTLLKAIDGTLGLTAGTAAAALTAVILGWGYLPFRSTRAAEHLTSV